MKKILLILLVVLSVYSFGNSVKKIEFISSNSWEELNFTEEKNVYWYEIDESNALYTIEISGWKSREFGEPTVSPIVLVYSESMDKILASSGNEKPLLLETDEKNRRILVQVMLSEKERVGKCYIKISKIDRSENIYYKKKEKSEIQKFNENPFKKDKNGRYE